MNRDEAKYDDAGTKRHLQPIIQQITQLSVSMQAIKMPHVRTLPLASNPRWHVPLLARLRLRAAPSRLYESCQVEPCQWEVHCRVSSKMR
jgi:hypothetical protein